MYRIPRLLKCLFMNLTGIFVTSKGVTGISHFDHGKMYCVPPGGANKHYVKNKDTYV